MRKTLNAPVGFDGTGLHTGKRARLTLYPAFGGTGIVFRRTDIAASDARIPARYDLVSDTRLCTRLTNEAGVSVSTVEHLMAALAGLGITDALILIDGPEVPIMDGSAAPFVEAILAKGLRETAGLCPAIRILDSVSVSEGDKRAALHPLPEAASGLVLDFRIDFAEAAIGAQTLSLALTPGAFSREIANCRTFGRLADIERLRAMGLGLGGSLDNAVVVDGARVLNPGGLRRADEFVRHKMLDAVGDLALAGAPILGRYEGVRAGHEMTNRLLHALFERPDSWEWADHAPDPLPVAPLPIRSPSVNEARLAV
ncbi:MAG: UDP-3-O-acyl-N-acetylglucosamine deacetylase [Pseudomonadota bacterium]